MESSFTEAERDFIQLQLRRVSRTFALGIELLEPPLREEVGIAYLLCRILDTLEDSTDLSVTQRIALLRSSSELLDPKTSNQIAAQIEGCFADVSLKGFDVELCQQTSKVLELYFKLEQKAQKAIAPHANEMASGMAFYAEAIEQAYQYFKTKSLKRIPGVSPLLLRTKAELDRYCYYVAGTVGELLCGLFKLRRPTIPKENILLMESQSVAFGLGLQLTNILKGIRQDLSRGVIYLPEELFEQAELTFDQLLLDPFSSQARYFCGLFVEHALKHLDGAIAYTLAIPASERDLRLFCALPLLFAFRTLATSFASQAFLQQSGELKISRAEVQKLHEKAEACLSDDAALKSLMIEERKAVQEHLKELGIMISPSSSI